VPNPEAVRKVVTRFEPPSTHPVVESENHYTRVHVPLASAFFLRDPRYLAYYTSRVEAQYSRAGSFSHVRTAWRFVTTYLHDLPPVSDGSDATALAPAMLRAMTRDIPHCLRDLRRCPVEERVVVAQPGQRLGEATYLFEYDVAPGLTPNAADRDRVAEIAAWFADTASQAPGFRGLVQDLVEEESEAAPLVEDGQAYTGRLLPSNKAGYLWAAFDNERLAEQFLGDPSVALRLLPIEFDHAAGYRLLHQCEFDLRSEQ
jgi:hypothetical protein